MRDFMADLIETCGMPVLRILFLALQSAVLMVLLRVLHEVVDPRIPAYGFVGCMIIVAIKIALDMSNFLYRVKD